jgi:hypothetical protein
MLRTIARYIRRLYRYRKAHNGLYRYPLVKVELVTRGILKDKKITPLVTARNPPLIVSLTSYGTRVKIVHRVIYSLFIQNCKPDKIILWLSDTCTHIPRKLRFFKKYGLEIRFTEDIRSYKKLVPALQSFPDSILVTCDDDMWYSENWLASLYDSYLEYPEAVHCHVVRRISKDIQGTPLPYKDWVMTRDIEPRYDQIGIGAGGILYPPGIFGTTEVTDKNKFMQLAPYADDLWFWCMAVRAGNPYRLIPDSIQKYIDISPFTVVGITPDTPLSATNMKKNLNIKQYTALVESFPEISNL